MECAWIGQLKVDGRLLRRALLLTFAEVGAVVVRFHTTTRLVRVGVESVQVGAQLLDGLKFLGEIV